MVFTGTYEHAIDSKNRLAIPADIRAQVQGKSGKTVYFFVTLGEGQSLCVYTEDGFNKRAEELTNSDADPDELLVYERMWFSLARRIEMDKSGRVRLPENLIERSKLQTQVVLLGVNDHLEVRDRTAWLTYVEQVLAEQPQLMVNPRRINRRRQQAN